MIDYISLNIPLPHKPLPSGKVLSIDHHGVQEWCSPKRMEFASSWEDKMFARSQGALNKDGLAEQLFLTGNPSKFLQGHNIFGSEDLVPLLNSVIDQIPHLFFECPNFHSILLSSKVSRIDFTKSISFKTREQVRSYIKQLSLRSNTRTGRPMQKGWTLTYNKDSGQTGRRWQFVIYSKGDELEKNKLPEFFHHKDFIQDEADKLCRIEMRLRSKELHDINCRLVKDLTPCKLNELYETYLERIQMNTVAELPSDLILSLPRCVRDTYFMWHNGINVQSNMSHATYHRHASKLRNYGIDISIARDPESLSNLIPLTTAVQGQPYVTPQFAYENNLIFQSKKQSHLRLVS